MSVVAIIQARMGSTRLAGKVMRKVCGITILGHVVSRVWACTGVDRVVVAIPDRDADQVLIPEAERHGADCFAGSHEDVLLRYYEAAKRCNAETVIRVTSDCPLLDPDLVGAMLKRYHALRGRPEPVDYLSNTLRRTFPRGLDAEVFSIAALCRANQEALDPAEREHVTLYMYRHPERFALSGYESADGDWSHLRWTVDTEADLELVSAIYDRLFHEGRQFGMSEVLALLEKEPELSRINAHVSQKEVR